MSRNDMRCWRFNLARWLRCSLFQLSPPNSCIHRRRMQFCPPTRSHCIGGIGKRPVVRGVAAQGCGPSGSRFARPRNSSSICRVAYVLSVMRRARLPYLPNVAHTGMPDMNGCEIARKIRSESWGSGVLLIAMTGWGREEDKRTALAAGIDHHLTKPLNLDQSELLINAFRRVP